MRLLDSLERCEITLRATWLSTRDNGAADLLSRCPLPEAYQLDPQLLQRATQILQSPMPQIDIMTTPYNKQCPLCVVDPRGPGVVGKKGVVARDLFGPIPHR